MRIYLGDALDTTSRVYAGLFVQGPEGSRDSRRHGGPVWKGSGKQRWRPAAKRASGDRPPVSFIERSRRPAATAGKRVQPTKRVGGASSSRGFESRPRRWKQPSAALFEPPPEARPMSPRLRFSSGAAVARRLVAAVVCASKRQGASGEGLRGRSLPPAEREWRGLPVDVAHRAFHRAGLAGHLRGGDAERLDLQLQRPREVRLARRSPNR